MRRTSFALWVTLLALASGCVIDGHHYSNDDPVDAHVVDGPVGDAPVPDAPLYDAACIESCSDTAATTCPDGPGGAPLVTACSMGCTTASGVHCLAVAPSNGIPLSELDTVTGSWLIPANVDATFYSDDGAISGVIAPAGVRFSIVGGLGVLSVNGLSVAAGARLVVVGTRPLVILSRGDVVIHGIVNAAASLGTNGYCPDGLPAMWSCPGPGGGRGSVSASTPATGCGPGGDGPYGNGDASHAGGGGGGFVQAGGDSGIGGSGAGAGGGPVACPGSSLVPLRGGSGGGGAQQDAGSPELWSAGGSGGGAIQITSLTSIVVARTTGTASINVTGAGGKGTKNVTGGTSSVGGGGGGGAGGAVLLEAPSITLDAAMIYGGGGGGGAGSGGPAVDGDWGMLAEVVAAGGQGTVSAEGRGGDGGAYVHGTLLAAGGGGAASAGNGTGGGGGSTGRLRINVYNNQLTERLVTATVTKTTGPIGLQ